MKIEYSYTIVDKRGNEIANGKIIEDKYNEIINSNNIVLKEEWVSELTNSTLYGKRYKNEEGYTLYTWKEVFR